MDRYELSLYRFLDAILANREAAQDCAQDTFLRAFRQLRRGSDVNARRLYKVAHNLAMDEFRHRRKERTDEDALERGADFDPDKGLEIRQAWDRLSAEERSLLHLVAVEGLPAADIAATLGISVNAAYMRVSRARAHLRDLLGDNG
ncbi:MAG: RNA polymerase sigma factor [Chloroflexota bacterium]